MTFFVAFLIIFAIALFFVTTFKYKIEESLFVSISIIIMVLNIFGVVGAMNIGQYIIYALAFASIIYMLYTVFIAKKEIDFSNVISPGFVAIILSYIIYIILSRNSSLYIKDEVICYATAVRTMFFSHAISDGGCVSLFSYFFTSVSTYSEHLLYVSRWLFIWIAFMLPMSNTKWNKWYMVAIYSFLGYGIITLIDPEPKYLMDVPSGIVVGGVIAYLSVCRKSSKLPILILASYLALNSKENSGLIMFGIVCAFYAVYYLVELYNKDFELDKKSILSTLVYIVITSFLLIAKNFYFSSNQTYLIPTKYFFVLLGVFAFALIFIFIWCKYLYKFVKKIIQLKYVKISILTLIIFSLFAIFYKGTQLILSSFDTAAQSRFVDILVKYFRKEYFRVPLIAIIIGISIVGFLLSFILVKKEHRVSFVAQTCFFSLVLFGFSYVIGILYTTIYANWVNLNMMGYERYLGSIMILTSVFLIGITFASSDYWIDVKKQYIVAIGIALLLIQNMPPPGEFMFANITNQSMYSFKYGIRPQLEVHADLINENIPKGEDVLLVSIIKPDGSDPLLIGETARSWIYYYNAPRVRPGYVNIDLSDSEKNVKQIENFKYWIKEYKYVYIPYANADIYNQCSDVFADSFDIINNSLFVLNDNNKLELLN